MCRGEEFGEISNRLPGFAAGPAQLAHSSSTGRGLAIVRS
ncbi:hypothetical protein Rrhod_3179 [Rhodococcus rhodnii LMG 5362]|uniref:Uncharacterized protein n=1 Tax=Rhodococcus rhodnii LMG 5362 TaxID=1273125 RepID=R7WJB8_9NOCA|nr:hypothetical protein Rrhod_3179 [Rhodococcus rhodnii LMG 5362]